MVEELLKKLVATPSVTGSEEAIATLVFDELTKLGMSPTRKGDNVWATIGSGKSPRLLLNSHYDTVPASAGWSTPPFTPKVEDGKLYGLGSNDAKASVAAMIAAAAEAKKDVEASGGTLLLALVCNEEAGRQGLETIVSDLKPLDGAIVGEPNGMEICIAQKGTLVLNLVWKGKAAHAAHGSSDNVLRKANEDLTKIFQMTWPKGDLFLGETRLELTQFHAGDRVNVIPDRATAVLDIRYTPIYHPEEILGMIRLAVKAEVSVHSDRRKAVKTDKESAIVRAAQKAQPKAALVGSKTSSDWVFLTDIATIKMGPGNTEVSHTANEYVELEQVRRAVTIYGETIRAFLNR